MLCATLPVAVTVCSSLPCQFEALYSTMKCVIATVIDVSGCSVDDVGAKIEALVMRTIAQEGPRASEHKTLW